MAASYPASQPSFTPIVDNTDTLVASQFNQPYLEIEAIAAQTGAGEAITTAGGHVLEASDAATNTVTDLHSLEHITSGTAAALFGVGRVRKLEDAGGTKRVVAQEDVIWAEAAAANYLPLIRENTTDAGTVVGYRGFVALNDVAGTARTIIPDGTGDVTAILMFAGVIKTSGGATDWGVSAVANGDSIAIYNVGSDILTLTVSANGSVEVQRTGGSLTYDVVLNLLCWI